MSFVCVRIPAELDERAKSLIGDRRLRNKKSASRRVEWIIEEWIKRKAKRKCQPKH